MPSSDLYSIVVAAWRQLSGAALPGVCVGFSGGLDSSVLLHVLARLRQDHPFLLRAAHVHHGLVPGAARWGEACATLCTALQIPFLRIDVEVRRDHPGGLEAAAREARREALLALGSDVLALAHHRDDQAETLLFRAVRGAGVAGMAGMRVLSSAPSGARIWRPLLDVPRATLLAYAEEVGLTWIEDPSNADAGYARNYLRHAVMPLLVARFPGAGASLSRLARLSGEALELLDALAQGDLAALRLAEGQVYGARGQFDHPGALALSSARLRNVLRALLAGQGVSMPDEDHLREVERQFRAEGAGRGLRVACAGLAVCVFRERWWLEALDLPVLPTARPCDTGGSIQWGDGVLRFAPARGAGIAAAALHGRECWLRPRSGGERMRLFDNAPSRSLKNLLQEAAVPPWRRAGLPLLWLDGQLAWIAGIGVAAEFRCRPNEEGLIPVWSEASVVSLIASW